MVLNIVSNSLVPLLQDVPRVSFIIAVLNTHPNTFFRVLEKFGPQDGRFSTVTRLPSAADAAITGTDQSGQPTRSFGTVAGKRPRKCPSLLIFIRSCDCSRLPLKLTSISNLEILWRTGNGCRTFFVVKSGPRRAVGAAFKEMLGLGWRCWKNTACFVCYMCIGMLSPPSSSLARV